MKNLILLLSITIGLAACGSTPKAKTYTQQEAELIYKKGIEDSKPKALVLLTSAPGIDKVNAEFFFTSYTDSNGGGFTLPVDCTLKYLGKFDASLNSYKLYRGIGKAYCPKADFAGMEIQAKLDSAKPAPTPVKPPVIKKPAVVKKTQANSSDEK